MAAQVTLEQLENMGVPSPATLTSTKGGHSMKSPPDVPQMLDLPPSTHEPINL